MSIISRLRGKSRVEMIYSVGELVAGRKYDLAKPVADEMIVKGYALGSLAKTYTPEEVQQMVSNTQVLSHG